MVVISIVVGSVIYTINAVSLLGNALPMPFGFGFGVVISGSMEPDLKIGDFIVVVPQDEYEIGDWIVFQDGNIVVVHEVVSIGEDELITKGRANDSEDAPIPLKYVKGKVVYYSTFWGRFVSFFKSPVGVLMILLASGWFLYKSYAVEKTDGNAEQQEIEKIREEIKRLQQLKEQEQEKNENKEQTQEEQQTQEQK